MKKILCSILSTVLLCSLSTPVFSDGIDLSALSWDELIALKAQIDQELTTRDQWQEVEVPQGLWVVGEDIPEGMWTVVCGSGAAVVKWGYSLREGEQRVDVLKSPSDTASVFSAADAQPGARTQYTLEAKKGMYIEIGFTSVIFQPYTGKPDLGFK
nr:MAG TPA: hypothetical protein [Caudoviricetes sp.]